MTEMEPSHSGVRIFDLTRSDPVVECFETIPAQHQLGLPVRKPKSTRYEH